MYETALAETGYAASTRSTGSPRGIEYQVFARVTRRLAALRDSAANDLAKLTEAVHDNNRLWTTLALDVARPENGLPAELRSKIFYLYRFTAQHAKKVLAGEAKADVLVDINTAIMRGLRGPNPEPGEA